MEFKDRLKQYRIENNLTQEDMANKLCVSRQAVSKYETGRSYPNVDVMTDIAKLLGVSLDELLSREELAKESILSNQNRQKNKRNIIILIVLSLVIVAVSIVSIVLSVLNNRRLDEQNKLDENLQLLGLVGSAEQVTPTVETLENDKVFGYCFLYRGDQLIGKGYNLSDLYANVSLFDNDFDMTVTLSAKQRYCYFYLVYYNKADKKYVFEYGGELDLSEHSQLTMTVGANDNLWSFSVKFERVDTLISTTIYEYGMDGEVIDSKTIFNYEDFSSDQYTVSDNCLYLVVEEKFSDESGAEYFNREIIVNSEINRTYVYHMKSLNENGFGNKILFIYK